MIKTTISYIDEILEEHPEFKNEAALARHLNISRQAISQYRHGSNMSPLVALKVARLLDLHPMETISATMEAQAMSEEEKTLWRECYHAYKKR